MEVTPGFSSPPPRSSILQLSYPAQHVLLVTINREPAMNSVPLAGHWEGESLWQWFDQEPQLRVAILTGRGNKAFSAGADLVEQRDRAKAPQVSAPPRFPPSGFLGLSRRAGKKPVVAAVNGYALGGGFETVLNW